MRQRLLLIVSFLLGLFVQEVNLTLSDSCDQSTIIGDNRHYETEVQPGESPSGFHPTFDSSGSINRFYVCIDESLFSQLLSLTGLG